MENTSDAPRLPSGWEQLLADDGTLYFHELKSGNTYWTVYLQRKSVDGRMTWVEAGSTGIVHLERPRQDPLDRYTITIDRHGSHVAPPLTETGAARVSAALTNLLPDWEELRSAEGRVYYYNSLTGESVWDRPMVQSGASIDEQQSTSNERTTSIGERRASLKAVTSALIFASRMGAQLGNPESGAEDGGAAYVEV